MINLHTLALDVIRTLGDTILDDNGLRFTRLPSGTLDWESEHDHPQHGSIRVRITSHDRGTTIYATTQSSGKATLHLENAHNYLSSTYSSEGHIHLKPLLAPVLAKARRDPTSRQPRRSA